MGSLCESMPQLVPEIQALLRGRVPLHHEMPCARMRQAEVTRVHAVINMPLWIQYKARRQQFVEALRARQNCPWAHHLLPMEEFRRHVPHVDLERGANEVLCLHGTTLQSSDHIANQGFDDRLGGRELYGHGIYCTTDSCKAAQYAKFGDGGCIILARALVGHPFLATGPRKGEKRPPMVPNNPVPHDSVIALPGIPNGQPKGSNGQGLQTHVELVLPSAQLYPEYVISFRCPA